VKYRVEFQYREDTGEVVMLRVEADESGLRDADHDRRHDGITRDLADVLEADALIEEVTVVAPVPVDGHRTVEERRDEVSRVEPRTSEL
jgi:hypothetical protein